MSPPRPTRGWPTCWPSPAKPWRRERRWCRCCRPPTSLSVSSSRRPALRTVHLGAARGAGLRRLPGRAHGYGLVHLAAGRVHAAADLQRIDARPSWCSWSRRGRRPSRRSSSIRASPSRCARCRRSRHERRAGHRRARSAQALWRPHGGRRPDAGGAPPARSAASSAPTAAARRPRCGCCAGWCKPDGGGGTCLGLDIVRDAPRLRRQIGYMTQRFSLYDDLTVAENLDFVASVYELADRRGRVQAPPRAHGPGRAGGPTGRRVVRRLEAAAGAGRLRPARAEAAAARRTHRRASMPRRGASSGTSSTTLAAEGLTVLVSTHYMDEAERCGRIASCRGGRLVAEGSPEEVARGSGLVVLAVERRRSSTSPPARLRRDGGGGDRGGVRRGGSPRRHGPCRPGARGRRTRRRG